jgi:hypothetical protein
MFSWIRYTRLVSWVLRILSFCAYLRKPTVISRLENLFAFYLKGGLAQGDAIIWTKLSTDVRYAKYPRDTSNHLDNNEEKDRIILFYYLL